MNPLKLQIIVGSVRPNRFGDKPAAWVAVLAKEAGFEVEVVDLKDHQLPDYNEKGSPNSLGGKLENEDGMAWGRKVAEADAFIIVTPEYNHGYPASLKNAIDWTYAGWNNKPVGFVAYGTVGGARVVEQLRAVVAELQMADVRGAVHIIRPWELLDAQGNLKPGALDVHADGAKGMLGQLALWGKALKVARGVN
jgi:NAD(P)H-dependent FMN reductase